MERKQITLLRNREINQQLGKNTHCQRPFSTNTNLPNLNTRNKGKFGPKNIMQPQRRNENVKSSKFSDTIRLQNEDFIQANSTIWLNEKCKTGQVDFSNMDEHWNSIVQINFKTNEETLCPICMEAPSVARTDKCGHIYCYSCIIQYLSYDNQFYTKCALCSQFIEFNRLKRATIMESLPFQIGDNISLLLMKRNRTSFTPIPINKISSEIIDINSNISQFSNVVICPNKDRKDIINSEIKKLEDMVLESINLSDGRLPSIERALELIYLELENCCGETIDTKEITATIDELVDFQYLSSESKSNYIYYQEESGALIFLSPLNWSCLKSQYYDNSEMYPIRLSSKILDIEKFIVSEEFINRYRYLKYLPVGSVIYFVDIEIANFISDLTLKKFDSKIQQKTKEKRRKEQIEKELTLKKEKHESSFYNGPTYIVNYSSMNENSGIFKPEDFEPLVPSSSQNEGAQSSSASYANIARCPTFPAFQPKSKVMSDIIQTAPSTTFNLTDIITKTERRKKKKK